MFMDLFSHGNPGLRSNNQIRTNLTTLNYAQRTFVYKTKLSKFLNLENKPVTKISKIYYQYDDGIFLKIYKKLLNRRHICFIH